MVKSVVAGSLCAVLGMALAALAQTQVEMNQEAKSDYETADAELNKVYKELRANLSEEQKTKLKEVQVTWLKYRDGNAEFAASLYEGGSIAGMIYAGALTSVTEARTQELKNMFPEGYPEEQDTKSP